MHGIPARGREPAHLHFDVRFLVQAEHDRFRVSDESRALARVPAVCVNTRNLFADPQEFCPNRNSKSLIVRSDADSDPQKFCPFLRNAR